MHSQFNLTKLITFTMLIFITSGNASDCHSKYFEQIEFHSFILPRQIWRGVKYFIKNNNICVTKCDRPREKDATRFIDKFKDATRFIDKFMVWNSS